MNSRILYFIILNIALHLSATAQGINYQGIARNANGQPLVNQALGIRLSIIADAPTGTALYTETHSATTNVYGLYNIVIGQGTATAGSFSAINWSQSDRFIKIEIDATGGTNYADMGTTRLQAVPFALSAKSLNINGTSQDILQHDGTNWVAAAPSFVPEGANKVKLHASKNEMIFGDITRANNCLQIWNTPQDIGQVDSSGAILPVSALTSARLAQPISGKYNAAIAATDTTPYSGGLLTSAFWGKSYHSAAFHSSNSSIGYSSSSNRAGSVGFYNNSTGESTVGLVSHVRGLNATAFVANVRGRGSFGVLVQARDSSSAGIVVQNATRINKSVGIYSMLAPFSSSFTPDSCEAIRGEITEGTNTTAVLGINSSTSPGNIGVKGICLSSGAGVVGEASGTGFGNGVIGSSIHGRGVIGSGAIGVEAIDLYSNNNTYALQVDGKIRAVGNQFVKTTTPLSSAANTIEIDYPDQTNNDVLQVTQATTDALTSSPAHKIYWSSAISRWVITSVNGSNFPIGSFFHIIIFKR